MSQTRPVVRTSSNGAIPLFLAALAAIIIAATLAIPALAPGSPSSPVGVGFSPQVIASAQQWELQRRQQGGEIDWVARSARAWELQRMQQGG